MQNITHLKNVPPNKSIEKLFSKYELLFLDQANSSTYPPEILILYFPITENFLQHNPHHVFHRFTYFPIGPISFDHTPPQVLDIPNHMPSQGKLYADHSTLRAKHTSHQKDESLRAALSLSLSESWTTRSTKTLSSIESMSNSLQNGRCSFILRTLSVQTTTSTISLQKSVPLLQPTFTSLFHPYLFINSS